MELLTFFGGVWMAIAVGIFIILMIVGCTFDRHYSEGPKWYIFIIGLFVLCVLNYQAFSDWRTLWASFSMAAFWKYVSLYLLAGIVYSIIEFALDVRRSARYWEAKWEDYKDDNKKKFTKAVDADISNRERQSTVTTRADEGITYPSREKLITSTLVTSFLSSVRSGYDSWTKRIIQVGPKVDENGDIIGAEPMVNRKQLAASIGCWVVWWPFYAVSLIIGDLLTEVFRFIADVVAGMSGRLVKLAFRDVFKL